MLAHIIGSAAQENMSAAQIFVFPHLSFHGIILTEYRMRSQSQLMMMSQHPLACPMGH